MHEIINWLVHFVHEFGYIGIFIMAFLESTFVPIPSEVTMVPAGYLVQQGHMNFGIVFVTSTLGALGGSLANYFIAYHFGRKFLHRYGKYMFFPHDKMTKLDKYFASHGDISTFTGRLIPGVRHVISFPAGLAHMDLKKFCVYTTVGGGLWMLTLILVGYLIGDNPDLVHAYMPYITAVFLVAVVLMVLWYVRRNRKVKAMLAAKENTDGLA